MFPCEKYGTEYEMEHATLYVNNNHQPFEEAQVYFDQFVLAILVSGSQFVRSSRVDLEIKPGHVFIPEKKSILYVTVEEASVEKPNLALNLVISPVFLNAFYEEIQVVHKDFPFVEQKPPGMSHYLTDSNACVDAFLRLYKIRTMQEQNAASKLMGTLVLKELLINLFQSEALFLLKENFQPKILDPEIQQCIRYIKKNIRTKLAIDELSRHFGIGLTTFYKKFKTSTGLSPADYILKERIKQSKIYLQNEEFSLKEVAFLCGFNSYEYFSNSFKKLQGIRPSEYRRL